MSPNPISINENYFHKDQDNFENQNLFIFVTSAFLKTLGRITTHVLCSQRPLNLHQFCLTRYSKYGLVGTDWNANLRYFASIRLYLAFSQKSYSATEVMHVSKLGTLQGSIFKSPNQNIQFACSNGHVICKNCHPTMENFSICRSEAISNRNLTLPEW